MVMLMVKVDLHLSLFAGLDAPRVWECEPGGDTVRWGKPRPFVPIGGTGIESGFIPYI